MKITKGKAGPDKIVMKTRDAKDPTGGAMLLAEWWKAGNDLQLAQELCGTVAYLKTNQTYRTRQIAASIRLYCGLPVYSYAGSNTSKMDKTRALPDDRPTFNLIQSAADTLTSRLSQAQPAPKFLTDGGDYRQRHLAEELNDFVLGEFYQTKVYQKAGKMLRAGIVTGAAALKVYEDEASKRVAVDHVLQADLFVDENDSINGEPQQMYQQKLMDRAKLMALFPKEKKSIDMAPQAFPDNAADGGRTSTDQVLVIEGWKLPSGPDPKANGYTPGRHTIATASGIIWDDPQWDKTKFPFVFFNYSDPFLGFWGQGLAAQLFGTQISLNRILATITRAITLVGVPRVFVESSSKIVKAHNNNEIGVIITYAGVKPSYEVAPCNAPELYAERDKLINYGYRQCGVSDMQATGEKPGGLDSGEAIRSYDDINSDRFAELSKRFDNVFIDLAYLVTDVAMDIAKRDGKYQTVYPNKDGTKEIDLPSMDLLQDPFVIQCFNESSLPRTPAGRIATVTEQVQAGMLSIKEGRRLMRFPDLEANEKLDNASEERIFKILDAIVKDSDYTPPDTFMDLELASTLTVQYINLYLAANLEEKKADLLRTFFNQIQTLKQAAMPPPMAGPALAPQASPEPTPTSPLVPNTPAGMQQAA